MTIKDKRARRQAALQYYINQLNEMEWHDPESIHDDTYAHGNTNPYLIQLALLIHQKYGFTVKQTAEMIHISWYRVNSWRNRYELTYQTIDEIMEQIQDGKNR